MNSSRPYLVRALYEWIVDNDCTPHFLVNAEHANVRIPPGYAQDGQIVLNGAPGAVRHLQMSNQAITFEARFGGSPFSLYLPIEAVLAVYARENGRGMFFDPDEAFTEEELTAEEAEESGLREVGDEDTPPDDEPPRPTGRPTLRVVK